MTINLQACVLAATFSLVVSWSAFGAEAPTTPGETQQHAMLCVDAKSAAILGETIDDQPDLVLEIIQGVIRKHRCVYVPGELRATVTMQKKVDHVAAMDVWEVKWDGETWYVPIDAPREPDL